MPKAPSRRADDPPDIEMAPVRAENRDVWAKAQRVYDHYKLAWAFWLAVGSGLMWGIKHIVEPLQAVAPLQAQVAANASFTKASFDTIKAQLELADSSRRDFGQILKVFGKFICKQMTPDERYTYDVDCRQLPPPTRVNP